MAHSAATLIPCQALPRQSITLVVARTGALCATITSGALCMIANRSDMTVTGDAVPGDVLPYAHFSNPLGPGPGVNNPGTSGELSTGSGMRTHMLSGTGHRSGSKVWPQSTQSHRTNSPRSEEHTSELQSPCNLVC